ncbi:HAD family hydrolase [Kitasatospora cineracea]|uniref:HAD family hydrolase n=1 Tax=Kitasatospora cineracea TaxID=88074 RepID=UPI0033FB19C4
MGGAGQRGECDSCRRGEFANCRHQEQTGATADGGYADSGYAEVVYARTSGLVHVPDEVPPAEVPPAEAAPLLRAGLSAFSGLQRIGARPGALVAVQGIGGLGHPALQYARGREPVRRGIGAGRPRGRIIGMVDVVFFDLDGTLVDHRRAAFAAIGGIVGGATEAVGSAGPAGSAGSVAELAAEWWALEARHMWEYLDGECSFTEQHRRRARAFLPLLGEPVSEDPAALDRWIAERYLPALEESWQCYADVLPCLEALGRMPGRRPRLAVLTNGDPGQQRAKLDRFGLAEHFEAVLTPTELGAAKPAAYAAACRRMGTVPERAANVGDMLPTDVTAAAAAGLTGVWLDRGVDFVTGGPSPVAEPSVLRIEWLTELPELLAQMGS